MRYYIVLAAAAACLSVPAAGFGGGSGPRNKDSDVVCRRDGGAELGSHLRRAPRICKTRAEWREAEDHTQRDLRSVTEGAREREEPTSNPQR